MNICSIVNSLTSGGAEVLVSGLSAEFARCGDASLVIALCDAETVGNSAETERRIAGEIRDAGGAFVSLGMPASRGPLTGALALRKALRGFNPDAVHAHTVRALPMIALGRIKAPVVLTHHNTKLPFSPKWFRLSDRITDSYVAIGAEVEAILGEHVGKPIIRIPNAAGRSFSTGSPRQAPTGKARILSVGAISEQKNYPLLIETAAALKAGDAMAEMPEFRIAGGGVDLEKLRAEVAARGLEGDVQFLGERSDVPDLMRASDLYLNVSLYEGMPLTLLEAMASGLPIVATEVPGNRELVDNGVNGLKAPLGDPEAIARTIADALSGSADYAALSKGAIEKSADFSIENTAEKHRDLYRSLAAKH
ncbi:glycosyltransferase family 4 protein [Erythrobacter sp. MTPC3]|uniref:glycosyltransferase family 4 protein n=1 Tax=Erythrobacter sp. MTPC3 TaxID=3056564 RepID=UPI0036F2A552